MIGGSLDSGLGSNILFLVIILALMLWNRLEVYLLGSECMPSYQGVSACYSSSSCYYMSPSSCTIFKQNYSKFLVCLLTSEQTSRGHMPYLEVHFVYSSELYFKCDFNLFRNRKCAGVRTPIIKRKEKSWESAEI